MGHKIGDAVRLRDGSNLRDLLDPWDEATAEVTAVFEDPDGSRISLRYGVPGPVAFALPARDFVPDRPLATAPF